MKEAIDIRGGVCGATVSQGLCRLPLLVGYCHEHGARTYAFRPPKPSAPRVGKGRFTSHDPGWIDGRTRAGRALKAGE